VTINLDNRLILDIGIESDRNIDVTREAFPVTKETEMLQSQIHTRQYMRIEEHCNPATQTDIRTKHRRN